MEGFKEIPHTADWELEVWASDLCTLFTQAARGMGTLSGMRLDQNNRTKKNLDLSAEDNESLLVAFLSELLYLSEQAGLGFDQFLITIKDDHLSAHMEGAPILSIDKEIKAVTYHRLAIVQSVEGYRANLVFDV